MEESKKFYVGSAKETSKEGFVLELNVSQLKEALKDESVQEKMHTFMILKNPSVMIYPQGQQGFYVIKI